MEEDSIKKLLTSLKCSACGQHYEPGNIDILGHREDLWFLNVLCPNCRAHYLILAMVTREKVGEVVTDLTGSELGSFRDAGRITADEVLDMHDFLESFDGDFSLIFGRGQV